MTFKDASQYVVFFGIHKGETLDQIASTDKGLRYLDWLIGSSIASGNKNLRQALEIYLGDPAIQKELEAL